MSRWWYLRPLPAGAAPRSWRRSCVWASARSLQEAACYTNPANLIDFSFFAVLGPILGCDRQPAFARIGRCPLPAGPAAVDPGYSTRGDDRDRRSRHHAVLQRDRGTAVRLVGRGSHRKERVDADAVTLSAESTTAIFTATAKRASAALSGSDASSSANARMGRHFPWSLRSAKPRSGRSSFLPASFAT